MVKPLRLQKYIADCGICSRRNAEELIISGRVSVNDQPAILGMKVNPGDTVKLDNQVIGLTEGTEKETYLVYKPLGYTSSAKDDHAEQLVTELVPTQSRLYPVGRLDKNSEGLLILTNDGELTHMATHPKFALPKVYEVEIIPRFRRADIRMLVDGIEDGEDFLTLDNLVILNDTRLEITLHHGKKRHIRRMLSQCHYHVEQLVRTKIGPFTLATLGQKPYLRLSAEQVKRITNY